MRKKQRGISFIELNVSIVLFLIVALCIISALANCTLWVKRTTELSQTIHLAQWKMAETQYMSESDIQEGEDNFPAPFNHYRWQIQKLTPADSRLEGFTEIKVTAQGMTGAKTSLVILKPEGVITERGSSLFVGWKGSTSYLFRSIPGVSIDDVAIFKERQMEINQAIWSRDGKYIFIHQNGEDNKLHLYRLDVKRIDDSNYMKYPANWEELDTGVWTWFQTSPTTDEIVYVKQEGNNFQCIVKNYKTGESTTIYEKEASDPPSWDLTEGSYPPHKVVVPTSVCNPVFSPDGTKIALSFQSADESSNKLKVQIGYYDTVTEAITILDEYEGARKDKQDFYFCKPAWSPDGQKLTYSFFNCNDNDLVAGTVLYARNISPGSPRTELWSGTASIHTNPRVSFGARISNGVKSVWIDNNKVAFLCIAGSSAYLLEKTVAGEVVFSKNLVNVYDYPYDISSYYNGQTIEFLDYYDGDLVFNSGVRGITVWKTKADGTGDLLHYSDMSNASDPDLTNYFLHNILK